jgi:ribonuclease Z
MILSMPTLYLLGTGAAVSEPHRTTTMLAFENGGSVIAVDCGGDLVQRLMAAGVDLSRLEALIVTHEHPDHAGGFPLFMEKIWLLGRSRPIVVYGIRAALDQARHTFESFDTSPWQGMPEIDWREVALEEGTLVLDDERWRITAAPGEHTVPVIGLRAQAKGGGTVAYSCDTEPSGAITRLARDADILVHEATGEGPGHSSSRQAAEVARKAGAARLLLVHLPMTLEGEVLAAAREVFAHTEWGEEEGRYSF